MPLSSEGSGASQKLVWEEISARISATRGFLMAQLPSYEDFQRVQRNQQKAPSIIPRRA